jgi:hypothetical protein
MVLARQGDSPFMLSAAKHLNAHRARPFAVAQGDKTEHCHAERSEAPRHPTSETLSRSEG